VAAFVGALQSRQVRSRVDNSAARQCLLPYRMQTEVMHVDLFTINPQKIQQAEFELLFKSSPQTSSKRTTVLLFYLLYTSSTKFCCSNRFLCKISVKYPMVNIADISDMIKTAAYFSLATLQIFLPWGNSRPSKCSPDHRQTDVGHDEGIIYHPVRQPASNRGIHVAWSGLHLDGRLLPPLHIHRLCAFQKKTFRFLS